MCCRRIPVTTVIKQTETLYIIIYEYKVNKCVILPIVPMINYLVIKIVICCSLSVKCFSEYQVIVCILHTFKFSRCLNFISIIYVTFVVFRNSVAIITVDNGIQNYWR